MKVKMVNFFSEENANKLASMEFTKVRLKNKFNVGDFMVKANLDFVYSIEQDDICHLLNQNILGDINLSEVLKLCENSRVAIIASDYMEMIVFNVENDELIEAIN